MKALILNSGVGNRMGDYTADLPKCMVPLLDQETIIKRQLTLLAMEGIDEVVITTGPFQDILKQYVESLCLPLHITFVHNPLYAETNYIYSICLAKEYVKDDILLLHGDLVFERKLLNQIFSYGKSCMAVSWQCPLPKKDFKAVVEENKITQIGVEFFDHAVAAQPLYLLKEQDWSRWLERIQDFCDRGITGCYAEQAFNTVGKELHVYPFDYGDMLCREIDNREDLMEIRERLETIRE